MSKQTKLRGRLMVLLMLAAGCGGGGSQVRAPATAPTAPQREEIGKKQAKKELPPAFLSKVVCDDLLGDAAPLLAVRKIPTEEQMARILNIATAVEACPVDKQPKLDDLRVVLVQARKVLADWYSEAPEERAASLAGDTSVMGGDHRPVMDARRWAEAYLRIEERLANLLATLPSVSQGGAARMRDRTPPGSCSLSAPAQAQDGRRLDDLLGWCTVPHVLMRVDAMAGALSNMLAQTEAADRPDVLNSRLGAFRDSVLAEAAFWVGAPTYKDQRVAVLPLFPGQPTNTEVLLSNRLTRISSYFKHLSLSWNDRAIDVLRNDLGNTFRSYVSHLENHGINIEKITWPARVDDGIDPKTGATVRTRTVSLHRLHDEILFDEVNLQALFEIRDAEDRWAALLDRNSEEATQANNISHQEEIDLVQARMQAVEAAAQLLLRGFRHTETRQARVVAASRLVMTVDLEEGSQGTVTPKTTLPGPAKGPPAAHDVALRSYTSRVLAELALCLLDDALLDVPVGHGCTYPIRPPPPAGWGAECTARPLAGSFAHGPGAPPPIPERGRDAYDRVIAALEYNWTATGRPPDEKPIVDSSSASTATVCELSFFTSADTMARLGMSMRAYRRLVALIADRRLPIDAKQSGPVLAAGMKLADQKMQALCDTFNPGQCSAQGLAKRGGPLARPRAAGAPPAAGAAPAMGAASFAADATAAYCHNAEMGEGIYKQSTERGPTNGIPLVEIVEPYLPDLTWRDFRALGEGFVRANRDCGSLGSAISAGKRGP